MYNNITQETLRQELINNGYVPRQEILNALFDALTLDKPLLVDGPPGVGKTELAKVVTKITSSQLIRLQCYEGITINKVLYEFNYSKMELMYSMLGHQVNKMVDGKTWDEAVKVAKNMQFFGDEDFLIKRPVLQALDPSDNRYKVLLIDEIDKADEQIEALLLEPLSDYSVSIPEIKRTITCTNMKPIIIITSNNIRELGEALRRRCIYVYIDYPDFETEMNIIRSKANVPQEYAIKVATILDSIRKTANMRKAPSIAEGIEWATAMYYKYNIQRLDQTTLNFLVNTTSTLAKYKEDCDKLKNYFSNVTKGKIELSI